MKIARKLIFGNLIREELPVVHNDCSSTQVYQIEEIKVSRVAEMNANKERSNMPHWHECITGEAKNISL